MLQYQILNDVTVIIEDIDKTIDITQLNKQINDYLLKHNCIYLADCDRITRAIRQNNVCTIDRYAIMGTQQIIEIVSSMIPLKQTDDLTKKYTDIKLPFEFKVRGTSCGGLNSDARSIDKNISPLVEVLNLMPDIKTFASCDGHHKTVIYILWKASSRESEELILKFLDEAFESSYPKYNFNHSYFTLNYLCGYGLWPNINHGLYFELRINYNNSFIKSLDIYNFIQEASNTLKEKILQYVQNSSI